MPSPLSLCTYLAYACVGALLGPSPVNRKGTKVFGKANTCICRVLACMPCECVCICVVLCRRLEPEGFLVDSDDGLTLAPTHTWHTCKQVRLDIYFPMIVVHKSMVHAEGTCSVTHVRNIWYAVWFRVDCMEGENFCTLACLSTYDTCFIVLSISYPLNTCTLKLKLPPCYLLTHVFFCMLHACPNSIDNGGLPLAWE